MKSRLLILLFSITLSADILSQSVLDHYVVLDSTYSDVDINRYVAVLQDDLEDVDPESILNGQFDTLFKLGKWEGSEYGLEKRTIWRKFSVESSNSGLRWLLMADRPGLDTLILYHRDGKGQFVPNQIATMATCRNWPYGSNTMVLDLPLNGSSRNDYYLKTVGQYYNFPLRIIRPYEFVDISFKRNIVQGVFIGFYLMMLLYNVFIFFIERDRSFLYFVSYVFINGIVICGYKFYLSYFLPELQYSFSDYHIAFVSLNFIALLFFSRNILNLIETSEKLDRVLLFLFAPALFFGLILIFFDDSSWVVLLNFFIFLALISFLLFSAYAASKKDGLLGLFYVLACVSITIGAGVFLLTLYGVFPRTNITNHALELGAVAHIMLFSFANGNKIRKYRLMKFEMEKELLVALQQNERIILEQKELLEIKAEERKKELLLQKEETDKLLLNIIPAAVASELKEKGKYRPVLHENVSVLHTDFVKFTSISERLSPQELVHQLDLHFSAFDHIMMKNGVEKVRTIGDAYLAICGLHNEKDHAERILKAALEIRDYMSKESDLFEIRIGVHSGSVVAGIIGENKFTYDILGETVYLANWLERLSQPGRVNISSATKSLLNKKYEFVHQGEITTIVNDQLEYYFVETMSDN